MSSPTPTRARAALRWDLAARVPMALALPALVGAATGHLGAGLAIATVALWVSIADPGPDLRSWPWLLFGAVSVVSAVVLGAMAFGDPALGAAVIALFHVLHGATGRVSAVAGLAGSSASTAALVTAAALGGYAGPATMVPLALAGAGWALALSLLTGRYLPTPRLTLPAPVATITGHPSALLDMARSEWRFPLLLGAATGGVYLLAVGVLDVRPYWVVVALAATLRAGPSSAKGSARDTVVGTIAGAVLATSLVHLVPGTWPLVLALLVITVVGLLVSLAEPRLVRVLVTPVVVIAAGLATGDGSLSPDAFAALRVLDFAVGAGIALALAWLVGRPWVRTQPGGPGAESGGQP